MAERPRRLNKAEKIVRKGRQRKVLRRKLSSNVSSLAVRAAKTVNPVVYILTKLGMKHLKNYYDQKRTHSINYQTRMDLFDLMCKIGEMLDKEPHDKLLKKMYKDTAKLVGKRT